jgi:hypothetical protein
LVTSSPRAITSCRSVDYAFAAENPLVERLLGRLT